MAQAGGVAVLECGEESPLWMFLFAPAARDLPKKPTKAAIPRRTPNGRQLGPDTLKTGRSHQPAYQGAGAASLARAGAPRRRAGSAAGPRFSASGPAGTGSISSQSR